MRELLPESDEPEEEPDDEPEEDEPDDPLDDDEVSDDRVGAEVFCGGGSDLWFPESRVVPLLGLCLADWPPEPPDPDGADTLAGGSGSPTVPGTITGGGFSAGSNVGASPTAGARESATISGSLESVAITV